MNQFKKLNNIIGWSVFLIASFVYLSTIEQTVSFWDCGEYISTAYKLEVGHPPGAPLFQLFGRIFTLFAAQGTSEVAVAINILSALCSSFTILFLFWTITAFGRKLFFKDNNYEIGRIYAVLGSGIVGALAYTFSDSFWFSAVEGEVYAMSSFFTAITFWCIMKWEQEADQPHASRWLVLIAYLIGLSVGVHLLSLLTIPAMGMIYYYKKYEYKKSGAIKAFVASMVILGLVQGVIIPGVVSLISDYELFFTNEVGLPFNSGTIIYFLLLFGLIAMILYTTSKFKTGLFAASSLYGKMFWTSTLIFLLVLLATQNMIPFIQDGWKNGNFLGFFLFPALIIFYFKIIQVKKGDSSFADFSPKILNLVTLSFLVLLIGYSSFAILVIRSNANPPIDENNPEDAVGLLSYLKREQYGSWPIVYGQHFNAKLDSKKPYLDGNPVYAKDEKKGKYVVIDKRKNTIPNYSKKDKMLFPRIWSNTQARHAGGYVTWAGLKNKDAIPTFGQNLTYFFKYQIGWSYLRYFMWNFAGRQNDFMNMDGNSLNGNWESGIGFIDNARLGTPSSEIKVPDYLGKNKGKNHYYFLPLLLGLIGMLFHFKQNNQDALAVLLFFLFTGVLIIIYLNVVPFQPRERDYAYVGSFYAFAIWIGLGVLGIYDFLSKRMNSTASAGIATVVALIIPTLMAAENWDDHDRSGRFTALEVAKNYLESCDKNAILFTNGDNDTFPLWYAQEVQGIRTDIKVVNLSLFNTPWYIDQMKRASYDAAPIPSSLEHDDYRAGTRDYTPINERFKDYVEVKDVVNFINSKSAKAKINTSAGLRSYCPTKKLKLTVNKEKVKSFIPAEYQDRIVDELQFKLKGNGIFKNKLMVLDILANFGWERPIYFAITVGRDNFMGLEKYFQLEGLAYRLVPYIAQSSDGQTGVVHTEKMYDRLVKNFQWGGFNNSDLYFDETNTRMVMNFRNNYSRLAEALLQKGETAKAIETLDKCMAEFPRDVVNLSYFALPIIDIYYKLGETEKGKEILAVMIDDYLTEIKYLKEFDRGSGLKQNIGITGQVLGSLARVLQVHRLEDLSFSYTNEEGVYYKSKGDNKEEVDFATYRINTFMDEYLSIQ
jgi:tetratricopeptide (TPR) repeat protein